MVSWHPTKYINEKLWVTFPLKGCTSVIFICLCISSKQFCISIHGHYGLLTLVFASQTVFVDKSQFFAIFDIDSSSTKPLNISFHVSSER